MCVVTSNSSEYCFQAPILKVVPDVDDVPAGRRVHVGHGRHVQDEILALKIVSIILNATKAIEHT